MEYNFDMDGDEFWVEYGSPKDCFIKSWCKQKNLKHELRMGSTDTLLISFKNNSELLKEFQKTFGYIEDQLFDDVFIIFNY